MSAPHLVLVGPNWADLQPILRRFNSELARRIDRSSKLGEAAHLGRDEVESLARAIAHFPSADVIISN
jgi:hypothetical protein